MELYFMSVLLNRCEICTLNSSTSMQSFVSELRDKFSVIEYLFKKAVYCSYITSWNKVLLENLILLADHQILLDPSTRRHNSEESKLQHFRCLSWNSQADSPLFPYKGFSHIISPMFYAKCMYEHFEICALPEPYAAQKSNCLPTFWDNLSITS